MGSVFLSARTLRRAGLSVDSDQTRRFADVLALLGFDRRGDVKAAGRAGFVRGRDQRPLYDPAFGLLLRPSTGPGARSSGPPRLPPQGPSPTAAALRPAPAT